MTDYRKAAQRARQQVDFGKLRDFSLDEIDLSFLQKKREEEAESRGFLGGFLFGVVVGALIALIFAPQKGRQTRELVADAAGSLKGRATELVHQARSGDENTTGQSVGDLGSGPAIEREIGDAAETSGSSIESATTSTATRQRL